MLANKVAVVTGASRGAGKGVALALGDAGATVYVTGRSSRSDSTAKQQPELTMPGAPPGTVEETAEEVSRRGGKGIAVVCDHTDPVQVRALFARVADEQDGRLDVLVNAAWGGNELPLDLPQPFWEMSVEQHWENMFGAGVRAALLASTQAAALMVPRKSGLVVNVTAWDDDKFMGHFMYDLAKASLNRLAFGMSRHLQQHQVSAIALAAGWMRTERVLAAFGCGSSINDIYGATADATTSAPADTASQPPAQQQLQQQGPKHWTDVPELAAATESPLYLGRAVVALAADPQAAAAASQAGRVVCVADLAVQHGFTDVDGRQPGRFRLP